MKNQVMNVENNSRKMSAGKKGRRILVLAMAVMMMTGLCSCKNEFNSKIGDVRDALEEKCGAEKAEDEQYDEMVDTQYQLPDVADDFKKGVFSEIKSKNYQYFGFHTVVDTSKVKSLFKYMKTDPDKISAGSVPVMEVLVVQFSNADAATGYFNALMSQRKKAYTNNESLGDGMFNKFVEKKEYFAFACESEYMYFNVYAQIDGKTVMYAFVEGPVSDTLKKDFQAFMKEMECSFIEH